MHTAGSAQRWMRRLQALPVRGEPAQPGRLSLRDADGAPPGRCSGMPGSGQPGRPTPIMLWHLIHC